MSIRATRWILIVALAAAATALAEQKKRLGPFDVHYSVVPSTFFGPEIAERYGIVRGRDRGLVNVTVIADGKPVVAAVEGYATNLLGQQSELQVREVREGEAVYYLAPVRYTDRETLRFRFNITATDGVERVLEFQQEMFWDDR